jgi:hypothetical protein
MSRGQLTSSTMGAEWSVISQHHRNTKPLLTIQHDATCCWKF